MNVPATRPFFSEEDIQAVLEEIRVVLRSGRLILGPYTRKLEESFREYCGVKHAVAVSSCTAALEIALRYFDVAGKEVIVPTNTFLATANAVLYSGGQPVLVDMDPNTLCLDLEDCLRKITPRTRGIIAVHVAGLPCPHMDELKTLCRQRGLFLLEDVAHAHGAMVDGRKTGSMGDAGCFSFYPTKVMTTCTGGMVTTDDDRLAEYAVSLRHHGVGTGLHHIVNLGSDWLMDEISAVLGIYQLKSLEANLGKRNHVAGRYAAATSGWQWLRLLEPPANVRHSYYKCPALLSSVIDKRELVDRMHRDFGVDLGSVYDPPCHLQPVYQRLFGYRDGMFPNADDVLKRVVCLPVFPQMTPEETGYVVKSLELSLPAVRREQIAA